jgi:hypothetical protein
MNKKHVSSSNLSLRFYKGEGWTREEIEPYLLLGDLMDTEEIHGDNPDWAYYILSIDGRIDMERFYEEKVSSVHRAFDDYPDMTDLEFLKSKNW